ncbi:MAG TPA: TRAP transporter small permease [Candidatus Acidoferrum sp.]|nr:TRAP transporter small permease [Candidatus Acidoferrum sp.]
MKRTVEYVIGLILFLMFFLTFFQVLARTVFHISAVWSEELARLTYVCMVFLGAGILIKDDGFIRVTVLVDRIGRRPAAILRFITDVALIPFLAVLTWGAWTNTRLNWNTFAPTVDWLRIGYVYLVVFISGLLMLWYLLLSLIQQARSSLPAATRGPEGWQ